MTMYRFLIIRILIIMIMNFNIIINIIFFVSLLLLSYPVLYNYTTYMLDIFHEPLLKYIHYFVKIHPLLRIVSYQYVHYKSYPYQHLVIKCYEKKKYKYIFSPPCCFNTFIFNFAVISSFFNFNKNHFIFSVINNKIYLQRQTQSTVFIFIFVYLSFYLYIYI